MSRRREYSLQLRCQHAGCDKTSFYVYSTQREYRDGVRRQVDRNWFCTRHSDDRLLTPDKLTATKTLVSGKSKRYADLKDLFWNDISGFAYGSSWKAFAKDFPEGTQIIETVQVILPKELK